MRLPSSLLQFFLLFLLITEAFSFNAYSQTIKNDSIVNKNNNLGDSAFAKTPVIDTTISKDAIKSKVEYNANDSLRLDMSTEKVFLYKTADVKYEQVQLNADYIELDLGKNLVSANGVIDTNGKMVGEPIFKDGDQEFNAGKMSYNFETEKGKIQEVRTQEGEGYIKGNEVKKTETDIMYIRNGYYTTCNLEHPHFSLSTSKLKVIPGNKIITGPTVLKIDNVPTPLGLPFGFFPNKKGRSSGILIPTYGDSRALGFFLRDGGFYWGINDYVDLSLTGDIYSLGSWGGKANSRYVKKYKYNGNVNLSYAKIKNSFEEFPDYRESNEFFFRWNHNQDARARPGSRFSANVNLGTRENFTRNLNSFTQDYLTNTFQSSVSYSNAFPGKPFNLNVSARHNQNTQTGSFNLNIPDVSFNVTRQYPFKKMGKIGNEWWRGVYKNFGLSYSTSTTNQLRTIDTLVALNKFNTLKKDFTNGVKHNVPLSTSFKLLKHFSVNPSMNFTDVWSFRTIRKSVDAETNKVIRDTISGLERGSSYNFNTSISTKLYGMFQFKKGRIKAIRHVLTPQASFSYQPEINTGINHYNDTNLREFEYSIYEGSVYGSPSRKKSGRLGIRLLNNLEMKVKSKKDSTGVKKVTLFENFSFSSSYDLQADSLNWSPVAISARTRIGQIFTLQLGGIYDQYGLDSLGRKINTSLYEQNGKVARLTSGNLAVNMMLKGGNKKDKNKPKESDQGTVSEVAHINANPDKYVDFSVPWTFRVGYNLRYSKPSFTSKVTQTLNFNADLSLTENWKVGATSGYDFKQKDFSYTSLNINRNLHCWQLAIIWIPYGPRQSYNITLNVKSAVLQDLKLNRRRDYYDVIR